MPAWGPAWAIVRQDASLKERTSLQVDAVAEFLAEPETKDQLAAVFSEATRHGLRVYVLGSGAHTLFTERIVTGLVISTLNLRDLSSKKASGAGGREDFVVKAQAGVPLAEIAKIFLSEKLSPAIFLSTLRGTVGAAAVRNSRSITGEVPTSISEFVDHVEIAKPDGNFDTLSGEKFFNAVDGNQIPGIVTEVTLSWPFDPEPQINNIVRRMMMTRQLLDVPHLEAFRELEDESLEAILKKLGAADMSEGDAAFFSRNPNIVLNHGAATARDVLALVQKIQEKARMELHIEMSPAFTNAP